MQLDFSQLDAAESYRWLSSTVTPRPIAWVSTVSANGITNLAPFSFFQVICDDPATLMVNVGLRANGELKDTLRNAQDIGELVIHLVSKAESEHMNATAATLPHDDSEFDAVGIATLPSVRVKPPRIAAASVAFECTLAEVIPYPAEHPRQFLIFSRVLLAHIDDAVMADERYVDPAKLDLVGRLSGSWYSTTRDRFAMKRPA
ncbi:flavin reductase (DIM6/NTAB) family NADH-FMN oxidoreductase RutF [Rhodanobacter sp. ANJX3]|uniref:flavin reductase family protein n=1 Tax=Rhodanobacter sp. ANJX3 TaxID=2723083 RepID=UPI00160CBCBD|nr:flavin reductase family protein [Rhodanobacter sp. ANJX3]MBB5358711.1 flavin reductase (DIM6/NTAB) family NADH-FMN oxidoreductase RutF [Rhodanobacter sp. ANJX3]